MSVYNRFCVQFQEGLMLYKDTAVLCTPTSDRNRFSRTVKEFTQTKIRQLKTSMCLSECKSASACNIYFNVDFFFYTHLTPSPSLRRTIVPQWA